MGDEGRARTMSVELALRREFAYRKKLEMMQSQAKEASKQILEPMPSANERTQMLGQQKDVSKANVVPMLHSKERIQMSRQQKDVSKANVEPMFHSKEAFSRAPLTSAPNASGIKRKAPSPPPTILQTPPPVRQQLTQTSPLGSLFCDLCQVPCSSPFYLKQHLHGHKHKMKVAMTDLGKNSCVNRVNPLMKWCELCQVCCPNEDALEQHFKGKKHVLAVHRTKEENVQRTLHFE
ncbi:hypothetical protein RJ641_014607 [Dillenia turbinata]|uniref:U1-type domain-containing protein n=1 Tax=Dillenia turbinata TaxID=194707 RepID=A0AAN8UXB6_9MAGN